MGKVRGFTLIELVVVVLIIAIIAAFAIPSYLSQTRKSRRNAAESAMQQIALREESYRADCTNYCDASTATTGCATCNWSILGGNPSGTYYDYSIAVTAASTTSSGSTPATYTITATGKSTQVNDYDRSSATSCKTLTYGITTAGEVAKTPTGCWQK